MRGGAANGDPSAQKLIKASRNRIRPVAERLGMVPLCADVPGQTAAGIVTRAQAGDNSAEIMPRLPAKLVAGPVVDVDPVDGRGHRPAPPRIFRLIVRNALPHD